MVLEQYEALVARAQRPMRRWSGVAQSVKAHPAMSTARQGLGRRGEQLAAERLAALGFEIVARNFRCPAGEIDLVARLNGTWVFVEVRTRRGQRFGTPEDSITLRKRNHLIASAQHYLQIHQLEDVPWRIDAVAVGLSPRGHLQRVDVIENAVTG
jgi:putative endonuclease